MECIDIFGILGYNLINNYGIGRYSLMTGVQSGGAMSEYERCDTKMSADSGKESFWGFLSGKYIILSLAAAAVGIAATAGQGQGFYAYFEAASPAVLLILSGLWSNLLLKKRGVLFGMRKGARKSADPRVMGSMGDINGIGCMASALMGIAVLFSEAYLTNGGIFSADNFMIPLSAALSKALGMTAVFGYVTSLERSEESLYICVCDTLGVRGEDCVKKIARIGHYPGIMKRMGGVTAARLAAVIGFSGAVLMCAACGASLPYSQLEAALLAVIALAVTEFSGSIFHRGRTEDKHRLMSKSRKSFCVLGSVMFILVSFFFLFSFPIRSVFSTYEVTHDFEYHTEFTGEIDIISPPADTNDNAPLFPGFFLVSAGFAIVTAAASTAEGRDILSGISSPRALCGIIFGIAAAAADVFVSSLLRPAAALDGVMCLVSVSMVCLIAAVYLAVLLLRRQNERK